MYPLHRDHSGPSMEPLLFWKGGPGKVENEREKNTSYSKARQDVSPSLGPLVQQEAA